MGCKALYYYVVFDVNRQTAWSRSFLNVTRKRGHNRGGPTLLFEGQGGIAGFAKGQASVQLVPGDGGTRLGYTVKAMVGGKLAQVGARLIDGVAIKLADQFFAGSGLRKVVAPAAG